MWNQLVVLCLLVSLSSCRLVDGTTTGPKRDTHGHVDTYDRTHKDRKKRKQLRKKGYPTNSRKKGNGGYDKYSY